MTSYRETPSPQRLLYLCSISKPHQSRQNTSGGDRSESSTAPRAIPKAVRFAPVRQTKRSPAADRAVAVLGSRQQLNGR
jgi:hypothetical protein